MSSRFFIVEKGEDNKYFDYSIIHECAVDSRTKAINAFRTLYGEQDGFLLVEQVAVSEPAGSRDEADNATREDSVQQERLEQRVADLHRE